MRKEKGNTRKGGKPAVVVAFVAAVVVAFVVCGLQLLVYEAFSY